MLILTGDINLTDSFFNVGFGVGSKIAQGYNPFQFISRKETDFWVGNFEGVASDVTINSGSAANFFRISPKHLNHLHFINVYGLANNHAMQHGKEAYAQTVAALEKQGAICFGMCNKRSIVVEHQGRTISFTGFSQRIDTWKETPAYWHNPEYSEIKKEVQSLPCEAFKIVYAHWGNEFINYPSTQQKRFAHWLIDVGFDMVVGMHPHIMQGYEVYKDRYIFYSIGNCVFDQAWEPTHYGAIVIADFSNNSVNISTKYIKIRDDFAPRVIKVDDVPEQFRFEMLNKLLLNDENSEEYHAAINKYYHQYRKANHKDILRKMAKHPSVACGLIMDYIKRRL